MRIASSFWSVALFFAPHVSAQTPKPNYYRWDSVTNKSIVDVVPTYAGRWFDRNRALHASLVDMRDSSWLRALLESLETVGAAGNAKRRPKDVIIMEKGKYSYTQLDHWRSQIARKSIGAQDYGGIGVRDSENRIRVVVLRRETIEKVRGLVKSLRIPDDAVVVVVSGGPAYH